MTYSGPAEHLTDVWIAVRASLRQVLESTSLADLCSGNLPELVTELAKDPKAWVSLEPIRGTTAG